MTPTGNDKWKCFVIGIALFLLQFAGTAMAADSWAGYPDSAFAGGSGTKDDPWQIATPQQLAYLAQQVNTGTDFSLGKYFRLTADIDLSSHDWTPIGQIDPATGFPKAGGFFAGTFDGAGHTISGLTYSGADIGAGLFGCVGDDGADVGPSTPGTVRNLNVVADMRPTGVLRGRAMGGIAGILASGSIENCTVAGTIAGGTATDTASATGGIAGISEGTIQNCVNFASVTGGASTSDFSATGGIAGFSSGTIRECANSGTVKGSAELSGASVTGGIAGGNNIGIIQDCANFGTVEGGPAGLSCTGGVVGYNGDGDGRIATSYSHTSVRAGTGISASATGGVAGFTRVDPDTFFTGTWWWNEASASDAVHGIGDYDGNGPSDTNATGLTTAAFPDVGNFAGWSISPTPGVPDSSRPWFYPSWDPGRPRLSWFFDADGNPGGRLVPPSIIFDANGTQAVTLFAGDGAGVAITDAKTPDGLDGLTFTPNGNLLEVRYLNGTQSGTGSATVSYTMGSRTFAASLDVTVTATFVPTVPDEPAQPVAVTGVTLDKTSLSLTIGGSASLVATVRPANAANKAVTWSSNRTEVATVANGRVAAGDVPGTALITVTTADGGYTATSSVTVSLPAPDPTVITIDLDGLGLVNGKMELEPGQEIDVTIIGTPAGLKFAATGLPEGLILTGDGRLSGRVPQPGAYPVTLTVTAPDGTKKTANFSVVVKEEEAAAKDGGSGGCNEAFWGIAVLLLPALFLRKKTG